MISLFCVTNYVIARHSYVAIVLMMYPGLSHFMILRYLLSSLFLWVVFPTQAENIVPAALGESAVKRERTTENHKMR